ncbi:hypothetical protein D9613_000922 [Agrocybe pediades]|uniref:Uncharacterized protein n=1 Tax=Agrocybe pediades TaxID=84607 RepID=A0A8H4VSI6_9AGAR|nr:hypothetical protein D9613_000922 [Agrocybe pediades]
MDPQHHFPTAYSPDDRIIDTTRSWFRDGPSNPRKTATAGSNSATPTPLREAFHRAYASTPLYDPVHALLLLNNSNNPDNHYEKENVRPQSTGVHITAPLPLSYAVRGKGAYKSILSVGEEDEEELNSSDKTLTFPHQHIEYGELATTPGQVIYHDLNQEEVRITTQDSDIRPITPSTLIALTEPCLMAWCYDPNFDIEIPGDVAQPSIVPAHVPIAFENTLQETQQQDIQFDVVTKPNDWGY